MQKIPVSDFAAGLFAANAILYNHESVRRPVSFVTRKITHGVASIATGQAQRLSLGNLEARRDWGWAPDYVDGLVKIASADAPDDFILATGVSHSVADFVAAAFASVGITDWRDYVDVDPSLARPTDQPEQCGDPTKAEVVLKWQRTLSFGEVVAAMTRHDLNLLSDKE